MYLKRGRFLFDWLPLFPWPFLPQVVYGVDGLGLNRGLIDTVLFCGSSPPALPSRPLPACSIPMKKALLAFTVIAAASLASCGSTRSSVSDCSDCGLAVGSPGCCQEDLGSKAALCACGEVKGSDVCCDENAARCAGCGKIKGSAGCCK